MQIDGVFEPAETWLMEEAFPFWAAAGVDRERGGFVERLTLEGADAGAPFKRTRVIARQIYAFSHAAMLGFEPGRAIAEEGVRYLTEHAWLGADRGWARKLDRDGAVIDETPDLYDLAFVLYAFGWYRRMSGDPQAGMWAARTADFIERAMRQPGWEGFMAEKPETGLRQQNPHMHLLEAALANLEAGGEPRYRRLARELVALFRTRFFDPRSGTLAEFFDARWNRAPGQDGRWIEPGHQFEWAWILANYQRLTGIDMRPEIRSLIAFAEAHGVDRDTGLVYAGVRDDGAPLDRSTRLWPSCERLQAAVALYEVDGVDPRPVFAETAPAIMARFLTPAPKGAWIDNYDVEGASLVDGIPASSLYHVTIALAEMLRVRRSLARLAPTGPLHSKAARAAPAAISATTSVEAGALRL